MEPTQTIWAFSFHNPSNLPKEVGGLPKYASISHITRFGEKNAVSTFH
jgi:hypothetical protein